MEDQKEDTTTAVSKSADQKMMSISDTRNWYNDFVQFTKDILKESLDYGVIPGTNKPSLYKPGAEKLRFVYGLGAEFECIDKTTDLVTPYVDYTYKCTIRSKSGQVLAQCEGNCNSMEPKFGFLWVQLSDVPEGVDISKLKTKTSGRALFEFDFALNKKETTGQYGKPQDYWDYFAKAISENRAKRVTKPTKRGEAQGWEINDTVTVYRIPNPDVVGLKNTIMKMAQKRAFVGAVLVATGASEFFTQDVEDMEINGNIHSSTHPVTDVDVEIINTPPAAPPANAPEKKAGRDTRIKMEKMDSGKNMTTHWANAVKQLGEGNIKMEQVEKHYILTDEQREELQRIANGKE